MQANSLFSILLAFAALPVVAQQAKPPVSLRTVHDAQDRLTFQVPADWPLAMRDRELSTFRQEARSATRTAQVRYVVAMPVNPFPESTFSGAHFYLSVTPRQTAAQCALQAASLPGNHAAATDKISVGHLPASHVHDEFGTICTQSRDDVYSVSRHGACLRFDLAMNNFCGGEVSGVRDMSAAEVVEIHRQLEAILNSVTFQP